MIQRDVDAEINLINEFLADIDNRRRHMCHFVSGLQVAVTSILFAAVRTLEGKHSKEGKETIQEEEGTTTQACPRKMEESSKMEEEQMDNTLTEDEEASESNLSSELMKSLNNTLGDLEEAEKKLIEMDSQDHTVTDGQSSEPCYLDFMYEFLADFRLKLQQSCEEFTSLESQALALLEERKALQDLSLQIGNSPRKTMKPKHNSLTTVASDMETVDKSEDSAISEMKFTLPKDMYQDSIPLDTVAARKDIDSNDGAPFETKSIVPQKDKDKDTVPICTNETPQNDTTKDNTSPNTLTNIKQTNDTDVPSHKTPPKAIPGSTTEDSPCDRKESPEQVATDEEYDGPSPVGMRRMDEKDVWLIFSRAQNFFTTMFSNIIS
ncbi:hypothetical protein O3P69_016484 [Scylla paramamosain]|uniref:Uncharacterized protein n=1 Tax=Scylla paramamosain TaxID=85552 RepID=A0AAW0TDG2_SCYPA